MQQTIPDDDTCYKVLMKGGDSLVYCNITNQWKATVEKSQAYAAGFIIAIIALILIIGGLRRIGSTLKGLCCTCQHNAGCFALCNFVLAALLRLFWKVADVGIDAMTYYRLGSGGLIDAGIYRNPHVLNSLLAFTCLGVVAMLISIRLIYLKAEDLKEHGDVETLKLLMVLVAFLLEDSIQMFLEYFWIQKYVTIEIPAYLVVKDVIISVISFHALICSFWVLKSESSTRIDYVFFAFGIMISLAEFLRVGAVLKQYKRGTFSRDCLTVDNGRLWQNPFAENCMSQTDYWILVLTFLPFMSVPFLVTAFRSDATLLYKTVKGKFTSVETISDPIV